MLTVEKGRGEGASVKAGGFMVVHCGIVLLDACVGVVASCVA